MNRSPLFYPLNRGLEADAGGAADLQTDVMRFMAIISMCLVAIFALVQSIPLQTPTPVPAAAEPAAAEPVVSEPPTTAKNERSPPAAELALVRPEPLPAKAQPGDVVLQRPAPAKRSDAPAKAADPGTAGEARPPEQQAQKRPGSKGFTLRFESDDALTRLVAREVVGLYAVTPSGTSRLSMGGAGPAFWKSSAPGRVHEMDPATVPAALLAAWRRAHGGTPEAVTWGVALPPAMTRRLNSFLAGGEGGSLVIGAGGDLRLEP